MTEPEPRIWKCDVIIHLWIGHQDVCECGTYTKASLAKANAKYLTEPEQPTDGVSDRGKQ